MFRRLCVTEFRTYARVALRNFHFRTVPHSGQCFAEHHAEVQLIPQKKCVREVLPHFRTSPSPNPNFKPKIGLRSRLVKKDENREFLTKIFWPPPEPNPGSATAAVLFIMMMLEIRRKTQKINQIKSKCARQLWKTLARNGPSGLNVVKTDNSEDMKLVRV